MYSQNLQEYLQQIGDYAQVDPESIPLLANTLACFVDTLGRAIGARTDPPGDWLGLSVRLLLLSDGLARLSGGEVLDGAHYLVGLGFEQTGELLTRLNMKEVTKTVDPLESDLWYKLTLAFLHYLAGGYRVQALSVLRRLDGVITDLKESEYDHIGRYRDALIALRMLYSVRKAAPEFLMGLNDWYDLFFDRVEPSTPQELRLRRLAQRIRQRRGVVLTNLGEGDEANWLSRRGVDAGAADFWRSYLATLDRRGITAFTKEQVGEGFDVWLRSGNDLLVVLPTGSGKTVIGELRSALTLAQGPQVLWMLPTRVLVRQIKRELREAFEQIGIGVEELPTTEDFMPLFIDSLTGGNQVAATTPEKLASLIRSHPEAVKDVGLVVFDEAQILLDESRGTTAEFVLQQIRQRVPKCDIVLMSASGDIKDSLEQILIKLGRQPDLLVSDTRPTRTVYGVITDDDSGERQYPTVLLYPPGIQSESGQTENPFRLTIKKPLPSNISATDTAQRLVNTTTTAGLRTALFVQRVDSTETRALKIAKSQKQTTSLPERDIARLRIELGRNSTLEETSVKGVSCHHAGLTPLEQTTVEKWMREGIIKTVVATPTLAQGVNLPFDLSIVTYTTRSTQVDSSKPVSRREILNMLGRAGRAGYVSDGLGLLSIKRSPYRTAVEVLDNSRRIFFHPQEPSNEYLGLSRLIIRSLKAGIDAPDWLLELGGLEFPEVQSLVTFVLSATTGTDDIKNRLVTQLKSFPSMQQLKEDEIEQAALTLEKLVQNIRHQISDSDPAVITVLERTGMPIEILSSFMSQLRSIDTVWMQEADREEQTLWADGVVRTALENCSSRAWYNALVKGIDLGKIFTTVSLWRSGSQIAQLEANWQSDGASEKQNRIKLGRFLNHRLSLFSQFWGALSVCYEAVRGSHDREALGLVLQQLPTFIRDGVSSVQQLEWLREIGGLDRVLAHELDKVEHLPVGQMTVHGQVWNWRESRQALPRELEEQYRVALSGALDLARW